MSEHHSIRLDVIGENPASHHAVEALLNAAFPVPPGASFYDDFPVWRHRDGKNVFRVGAFAGSELAATASARLTELKTPTGPITVGQIGCVATGVNYRGKGFASRVLDFAIEWAENRGALVLFLWSSEHTMYQRLGFELCGSQARVPLSSLRASRVTGSRLGRGWVPSLARLLQLRSEGFVLRPSDISWLSEHKNVDWYWLGDPAAPRAYAAVGRGIDLQGFVHEWGGDRESLFALLSIINEQKPGLELLGSTSAFARLGILSWGVQTEYLCMAKVINGPGIFHAFHPGKPYPFAEKTGRALAPALFGPAAAPPGYEQMLPLPLWIWGLDGA